MWIVGNGIPGVAYFEQVLKVLIEETFRFSFCSFNWPIIDCKVWLRAHLLVCCIHSSAEECCMILMLEIVSQIEGWEFILKNRYFRKMVNCVFISCSIKKQMIIVAEFCNSFIKFWEMSIVILEILIYYPVLSISILNYCSFFILHLLLGNLFW